MAGYLDHYGAGEEKRENIIKFIVFGLLFALVFGSLGYYLFKNHAQESKTRTFLDTVRKKDFTGAYALWGCRTATPCPGYAYDKFLEDWGPQGAAAHTDVLRITDSESCSAGVIITVQTAAEKQEKLWVEKKDNSLGFSPFEVCPNKTPLSNMIHQTIGKLRKPFLN
jgi:hypothetical protein